MDRLYHFGLVEYTQGCCSVDHAPFDTVTYFSVLELPHQTKG